jgi:GH15 family glucan-1,4-alpha-glucosidase
VEDKLTVRTAVGGVARYAGDTYYRCSDDVDKVPGNPWFICTLWLAQWRIARAATMDQLTQALPILDWVADRALASGVLAEQVHPVTNAPLSVSPLTWSHATLVAVVIAYNQKLELIRSGHAGDAGTTGFANPAQRQLFSRSPLPLQAT